MNFKLYNIIFLDTFAALRKKQHTKKGYEISSQSEIPSGN